MAGTGSTDAFDLNAGLPAEMLQEGVPFGAQIDGESVLLVRRGAEIFAIGGTCTHYSGPLADGMVVGDEIRCPWHHACFSLRTGAVTAAPALSPQPRWEIMQKDGRIFVGQKHEAADPLAALGSSQAQLRNVLIIGGGAAGNAAAEELRRGGFTGAVVIIDHDADAPYDRPNLSKDYLAGSAPEAWLPLRPPEFEREHGIQRIKDTAVAIDAARKTVSTGKGRDILYDALILATGAEPIRIPIPGIDLPHVHVLRTIADCRNLIAAATAAKSIVIAGASFIGMEAAAALRTRGLTVTVVAPEQTPFDKVLSKRPGEALQALHERHGVTFRLGRSLAAVTQHAVTLDDGTNINADVVLLGIGVRPRLDLARSAGVATDNGVLVNEFLESSVAGIYAVGDLARYPSRHTGERVRIEHWVVAERMGAVAARNVLGAREPFTVVPFFWTQQYDAVISYVGHGAGWTAVEIDGSPEAGDCAISLTKNGALVAYITMGRDRQSLAAERQMELGIHER
jgi:NADPH-dependent 2,4-dienoyl-CoA reductase/sulfur reductase-like enzyme/nitrite reductase/ring-hydroxylating ferredoxin subunit